jgi:cytochrome c biogenesis protein CcmG/thiol:disulfide interchange protein DsbE
VRAWLWVLVVAFLAGIFWWGMQRNPRELPSVLAKERRPAPDFTLPLLPPYRAAWGETFRLGDYLGKRPIVLNFWASWCYPACYEEAPVLEAAWRKHKDRVLFVGVNTQDKEPEALRFIAQFGLTFPQVFDPRGTGGGGLRDVRGPGDLSSLTGRAASCARHAGAVDEATLEELPEGDAPMRLLLLLLLAL